MRFGNPNPGPVVGTCLENKNYLQQIKSSTLGFRESPCCYVTMYDMLPHTYGTMNVKGVSYDIGSPNSLRIGVPLGFLILFCPLT